MTKEAKLRLSNWLCVLFALAIGTMVWKNHLYWQHQKRNYALVAAATDHDPGKVQALLKQGADVDGRLDVGDMPGFVDFSRQLRRMQRPVIGEHVTALMAASMVRDPKTMEVLIKAGANVNAHDEKGYTPLLWAADRSEPGSGPIIRLLAEHGANVRAKTTEGVTAWQFVKRDPEALKVLNSAAAKK